MYMYLYEMIFGIFCLYFIHIDIVYECIVLSCIAELNLLLQDADFRIALHIAAASVRPSHDMAKLLLDHGSMINVCCMLKSIILFLFI